MKTRSQVYSSLVTVQTMFTVRRSLPRGWAVSLQSRLNAGSPKVTNSHNHYHDKRRGECCHPHLSQTAKNTPNQLALVCGAKCRIFLLFLLPELDQVVNRAVAELVRANIEHGDKTLLFVNPGPGLIIWAFALFR